MAISDASKDNVILFPKTIEYYHVQLTRLLESEQYGEAKRLLEFLLHCGGEDRQAAKDWQVILDWLEANAPPDDPDEGEPESEEDLLHRQIREKAESDPKYVKKLLETILSESALEKKLVALEQIGHAEHPAVNDTLLRWLEQVDMHPLIQFKILQTLCYRKTPGSATLTRGGETFTVAIGETPMTFEGFPAVIQDVLRAQREVSEIHHPALSYFAEQTWKEFLYYIYGTSVYRGIVEREEPVQVMVWASALHHVALETMLGTADPEETLSAYGLGERDIPLWDKAYCKLKGFIDSAFVGK